MQIKCPGCGTSGEVPATMQGKLIECNVCNKQIQLPAARDAQEPLQTIQPGYEPCKYCGEMIKTGALKCRHCNEFFVPGMGPRAAAPAVNHIHVNVNQNQNQNQAQDQQQKQKNKQSGCGEQIGGGCLIIIATIIILGIIYSCKDKASPPPQPAPQPVKPAVQTQQPKISPPPAAAVGGLTSVSTVSPDLNAVQTAPAILTPPPPPAPLTREQLKEQIMQQHPFKNWTAGDKVEFVIDEKIPIKGKLVEISVRGLTVEVTEGATVLYRKNRLTPESSTKFYRPEYDKFIESETVKQFK